MRGDVYELRAPRDARGHEQAGKRYAVVLQSDDLPLLSTWVVAPTSTGRAETSFRPEVEIRGQATRVLVEQMSAVDPEVRLGEFVGRLTRTELEQVTYAAALVLGLD